MTSISFVEASEGNAARLEAVLREFGFGSLGLKAADFLKQGVVVQLGYPPNRIDLLTGISGVSFGEAWGKRIRAEFEGVAMDFVDRDTLLANKAATDRPKDRADLDALS